MVSYASVVKMTTKLMIDESDIFNFNFWVSPQRLLQIENEVLQFQFSPCSDPNFFFFQDANFCLLFMALSKIFFSFSITGKCNCKKWETFFTL